RLLARFRLHGSAWCRNNQSSPRSRKRYREDLVWMYRTQRRPLQPVVRPRRCGPAFSHQSRHARGLRPELVPSVEVENVLPTVNNPAVLELEDDAAVNIQMLAVPLRAVVMNTDHAAVVTLEQVPQRGLEGPARLPHQAA